MSLSAPTPPAPPDPSQVANTQQGFNTAAGIASQIGSNVNQVTPFGSLTYNQSGTGPGGVPLYTATQSLSPEMQQLLSALVSNKQYAGSRFQPLTQAGEANLNAAGNELGLVNPIVDTAKGFMGQASDVLGNANYAGSNPSDVIGNASSGIIQDRLAKYTSYLQPTFTAETNQLDNQMRNQGLAPGNPAYDLAMENLRQSHQRTVTGFLAQAEPQAFSEAQSLYQEPLAISTGIAGLTAPELSLTNPILSAAGQYANLGSTDINAGQSMLNASAPTMPSPLPTNPLNIQPASYQGAAYGSADLAQKNYQSNLAQQQAMMSGLFGIPTALLGGWAKSGGVQNLLG
jgi:hypothetical protein